MTTQFTVGKTYSITGYNDTIKVVKRTEKSVWFEYAGETLRKKIHETSCGEKLVLDGGSACIFAVSVIEPQASINEPETIETPNNVVNFSDYHSKVKASNDEIISLDELDLIHLIQDLTLIELENKKLETLENPHSMNREDLIDRLAVTKIKRYKAFQNNWNTSKYDAEICEITDLLKQLNDRKITPSDSDNLNTLEFPQDEILNTLEFPQDEILETLEFPQDEILETLEFPQDEILETLEFPQDEILNTLEFPQDEILNTLEFPQDSTHELDRFEVVYQVLESWDEICYESRKVYATSKDHAKSIVSLDLQAQHLRYIITGCEYALLIDDLSDFSLEGHGEF